MPSQDAMILINERLLHELDLAWRNTAQRLSPMAAKGRHYGSMSVLGVKFLGTADDAACAHGCEATLLDVRGCAHGF